MIKVLICDGDGTVQLPNPGDQIRELIESLPAMGIDLAVASNSFDAEAIARKFNRAGLQLPRVIATRSEVGSAKPSPEFIEYIAQSLGVQRNEIAYLGDDDRTDIFCAINAGVLPISADYSAAQKRRRYGIKFDRPGQVLRYLKQFGGQEAPYFGWEFKRDPDVGEATEVYALIGNHQGWLTSTLERVLKNHEQVTKTNTATGRTVSVRNVLLLYFITQCYLSGLTLAADWFTVYPGHEAGSDNPTLNFFGEQVKNCFQDQFQDDLIVRHTTAQKSQHAGADRSIYEQFRTIKINPKYEGRIEGKTIVVMDDFTTYGYSLETARRMLLEAGAIKVIGIAIGKFRSKSAFTRIDKSWNPFAPCQLRPNEISIDTNRGTFNHSADSYFRDQVWSTYA